MMAERLDLTVAAQRVGRPIHLEGGEHWIQEKDASTPAVTLSVGAMTEIVQVVPASSDAPPPTVDTPR